MLINLLTRQTGKVFFKPRRVFSEIIDPKKSEWLDQLLANYKVEDKLAPYKESVVTEIDYQILKLAPNATVRQIYFSYTNHSKFLENPKAANREAKKKLLEDCYHRLIISKIRAVDALAEEEKVYSFSIKLTRIKMELDELLKQKLRLMSNVSLSTNQKLLNISI